MDHRLYLLLAVTTHGLVGYALVRALTSFPPVVGVVGAVAPDVDLLFDPGWQFPLVHRGITHTPALACALLLLAFVAGVPAPAPAAFGIGVVSHLVVDTFTRTGIMWLYPMSTEYLAFGVPIHGTAGTLLLWSGALVLVGWEVRSTRRRVPP